MTAVLAVGSTVWVFDGNRRSYDEQRRVIRARQWVEYVIIGENRASWLLGLQGSTYVHYKVDKATNQIRGESLFGVQREIATTKQEVDDDLWAHKHRPVIERAVSEAPVSVLREVAAVLEKHKPVMLK